MDRLPHASDFYSDYSLRLLMDVAIQKDELVTIQDVADAYGISKAHLMKVAHQLGVRGFLQTGRGRGGGLRLSRPADQMRLGDVVRVMEEASDLVECFSAAKNGRETARQENQARQQPREAAERRP